jgi:ribonuclease HI
VKSKAIAQSTVLGYCDGGLVTPLGVYWSVRLDFVNGGTVTERERNVSGAKWRTNNDAEWLALRAILKLAIKRAVQVPVLIYSDSLLVVNQFNGDWRVRSAQHEELRAQCRLLVAQLAVSVRLRWVSRVEIVKKLGH